MTLYKRGRTFWYDFWFQRRRYNRSTHQELRDDAEQVEQQEKRRVRRAAHGIAPVDRLESPSFAAWAQTYMVEQRKRLTSPDILERTTRVVLAFWGAPPAEKPVKGGVYHQLRLADPILDPTWIDRFEDWMAVRKLSASTRNSYRSCLSGMYKLALKPRWRPRTHVTSNPFHDIGRDRPNVREVHLSLDDLRAWLQHAPVHVRIALTIGALAPKLRLAQVLGLRFDLHLDRNLTRIAFESHKTRRHTHAPQVTAVSTELRTVLEAVRRAHPESRHVVTWRDKPVGSITRAAKTAATAAGLHWGTKGGVTFHALRHVFGTEAARIGIHEVLAAKTLGHKDPRTTRKHYEHLVSEDERAVVDQLATHLGLTEGTLKAVGTFVGTRPEKRRASEGRTRTPTQGTSRQKSPQAVDDKDVTGRRQRNS